MDALWIQASAIVENVQTGQPLPIIVHGESHRQTTVFSDLYEILGKLQYMLLRYGPISIPNRRNAKSARSNWAHL